MKGYRQPVKVLILKFNNNFIFSLQIKYDFKWLSMAEPEGEPVVAKTGEKVEEKFQGNSFERKHLPILNVSKHKLIINMSGLYTSFKMA